MMSLRSSCTHLPVARTHVSAAALALWPASFALLAALFLLLLRRRREAYVRWRELVSICGAAHFTTVIVALGGCCLARESA